MVDCNKWLNRLFCCRRESQSAYIYLYSPIMSSSSSSTSSRFCLFCILFGFCLAFIVILTILIISLLNNSDFDLSFSSNNDNQIYTTSKSQRLCSLFKCNQDPCQNFYETVCEKSIENKNRNNFNNENNEFERKSTRIRYIIQDKLLLNETDQLLSNESNSILSIKSLYQLCEKQSPILLLNELGRYFDKLRLEEPYRSYLTLFTQTYQIDSHEMSTFAFDSNPFFQIEQTSIDNLYNVIRINHRRLPLFSSLNHRFTNLNQTAFKQLIQFENDYLDLLSNENYIIKSYEQEYNQDSLILKRILTYSNYNICYPSLELQTTNGLEKLIELLNHFLQSYLQNFNRNTIDKQIRVLERLNDNHTLIEHLQRIKIDLKTIEQIVLINNTDKTCLSNLLDELLDRKLKSTELLSIFKFFTFNQTNQYFTSNHWPYLFMLYDRLLKRTSINTLVNYAYFHSYRQYIYPYYQPHIRHENYININSTRTYSDYNNKNEYENLSCNVNTCFDILNCYHPSLLNELIDEHNQTLINTTRILIENLIERLYLITEQSDNLLSNEKKIILDELNQIHIEIGHMPSSYEIVLTDQYSSYFEYVKYFSSLPYDNHEHSYSIQPIYYSINRTLFIPFGFLRLSNESIEYDITKVLLKIIGTKIQSNPFYIECLLKSTDIENDLQNTTKISTIDEHIVYLFLRSKYIAEQNIILDEYLWPFMNANSLMKEFLVQYTSFYYCSHDHGYDLYMNNTYLIDDIHLIFRCQQANSIKQSKCTVA